MKRWQKVLLIIFSVIAALVLAGFIVFKVYLEPIIDEKLGDVAVKMSEIINNEAFQAQVDEMAQSMMDDGVIKPEDVPNYMKLKNENEARRKEQEEAAKKALEQIVAEEEQAKANANLVEGAVNPESNGQPPSAIDTATNNQSESGAAGSGSDPTSSGDKTVTQGNAQQTQNQKPKPTPTPTPTSTPLTKETLKQRLKAAMTASEFSFALSMYSRIDLGYAQSLLKKDRTAAKEYIYSKASPAEISQALEIYAKYAYLLK